jgi:hypothetical protein
LLPAKMFMMLTKIFIKRNKIVRKPNLENMKPKRLDFTLK